MRQPRLLVADDQPDVIEALRLLLKGEGYEIETASSPRAVLEIVQARELDLVLMDLNYARDTTSGAEGLDLLSRLRDLDPTLPVVVMTAWASLDLAVEVMRRGARDFVAKPWDNARLLAIVRTQVELGSALRRGERLEEENRLLRGDSGAPVAARPTLIAEAPAMRPVLDMIDRVGPSDAAVLITGDNGSGKGTVAQALHAVSARAARPLVVVNAGGLSEGVFESELFGHVKGAFTDARADRVGRFELADGGTLFLDEIANVPSGLQSKLLRVVETGEFERVGSSRTRRVIDDPSRSNSPVSSTRSSLFCWLRGTFAISSRNSVPPSASSKRPTRSILASVNAPLTWPNSSLSNTPSDTPPALTVTIGFVERPETA